MNHLKNEIYMKLRHKLFLIFGLALSFSCKFEKRVSTGQETYKLQDNKLYGTLFKLDSVNTEIHWTGNKPTSFHEGNVRLKKGEIFTEMNGIPKGGIIWIDMNSIVCTDITDSLDKKDLEDHLKDSDFFNVDSFPIAELYIDSFEIVNDSLTNSNAHGQLTIKGITNPVKIKAQISVAENVMMIQIPEFSIDRTKWNISYKSKTIFPNLADKFIYDDIKLKISALAMRQ